MLKGGAMATGSPLRAESIFVFYLREIKAKG